MALLIRARFLFFPQAFSFLLLAASLCLLDAGRVEAQTGRAREYQIKAAFLFNFVQFVKWPGAAFLSSSAPFYIGVLGDDPFGPALEETIKGEAIDRHPLAVRRSQQIADLKDCQMIFVCRSEHDHEAEILSKLSSEPVLTVSELPGFAREGGDIDFYLSGDKIRFEINPQSAERQGLKISSQLLALGKIVNHGQE